MTNTHTYQALFGRVATANNVGPFTHTGDRQEAEQAWLEHVRTFLTDPDTVLEIKGHPDDTGLREVIARAKTPEDEVQEQLSRYRNASRGGFSGDGRRVVAHFLTHLNDTTCNGKYHRSEDA